ncbi:MAG: hypothetical protein DRG24_07570 [Epsilonproteobacteria bacterium]|nr:MAG: hypothetical protein DRG24_07570 [Campylobacterota bacterium]
MLNSTDQATVAIFGSCVSRDVFNSQFNKDYKKYFKVVLLQNQTTILSLMSGTITYKEESLSPLQGWDKNMTILELDKTFLMELKRLRPNILIIDFLADARFETMAYQNSYLTVNKWKLTRTKLFNEIKQDNYIFIPNKRQLKDNMEALYSYIKDNLPHTTIVLNKARALNYEKIIICNKTTCPILFLKQFYINLKRRVSVKRLNMRLAMLDNLFIQIANPVVIDAMTENLEVDFEHPWRAGHTHYQKDFYIKFLDILYSIYYQGMMPENLYPHKHDLRKRADAD